jgi:hypothetical protein
MEIVNTQGQNMLATGNDDTLDQESQALALLAAIIAKYHLEHHQSHNQHKTCSSKSIKKTD